MSAARFIVCEKTPRWADALRTTSGNLAAAIQETRSLSQCAAALTEAPGSFVLLDVTPANLEPALALLTSSLRSFPRASFTVSLAADIQAAKTILREVGAIGVFTSTLSASQVTKLALRHLASCPQDELDVHDVVAARMPWSAYGEKFS